MPTPQPKPTSPTPVPKPQPKVKKQEAKPTSSRFTWTDEDWAQILKPASRAPAHERAK